MGFPGKTFSPHKKRACRMHGRPEIIQSYKVKIKPEDQQQQVLYQPHFLRIS